MAEKFKPGDLVHIKATEEVVTINAVKPGMNQDFYLVFQNGKKNFYKESELLPYVDKEYEILNQIQDSVYSNSDSFQKYAYYRLFSENHDKNLFSYQGNKIIFNPFQYKPLMKFIGVDSDERLLVADEVGVGKTIESGIILDELISRGELKSTDPIMIVCPSILCTKWRNELRTKFYMDDFYIHDGKSLSYLLKEIKETGKIQYSHSIVSEQLFRGELYQTLLKDCLEERGEPFFKMVIVDECHHYRNPGTNTHKFGTVLSLCSERVLMLSATPFNLRSDDLYNQLHMLNPILFPDQYVFNQLLKQIRNINQAISLVKKENPESKEKLLELSSEIKSIADINEFISTDFNNIYSKISKRETLSVKEKVDYERILNMLNPIASSFTRTLKRDAIEHRVTRETMTLEIHYTEAEAEIYQSFLETNLLRYKILGISERALGLILNGLERIAASSIPALEKNVKKFTNMSDDDFSEMVSDEMILDKNTIKAMKSVMQENYEDLLSKIKALGTTDSKYDTFKNLIKCIQNTNPENKRIIVFSFYTETLKYLRKRLYSEGYKVQLMFGKTPDETPNNQKDEDGFTIIGRNEIMRDFEQQKFDIMLVSEVGGEGLDFQFCSSLINYDLPYNPMRIEQRIGRIDRMGQKADKIWIGNLCIENTIDVVINRVLLSRIADASDLVGELEPIISQELEQINQLIISKDFSEEALRKREKEIEQRIEKAKQTREEFDEARYELVNDKGFKEEFGDTISKLRISPNESLLFTYTFLKKENGCWCKIVSESSAEIHVSKEICERLRVYDKKMNLGIAGQELRKIVENGGDLIIDFDGNSAYEHADRTFFKPAGAWIHFIIDYIRAIQTDNRENTFYLSVSHEKFNEFEKARYWLFVYEINIQGFYENKTYEYILVKNDMSKVISLSEESKKQLLLKIKNAKLPDLIELENFDEIQMLSQDKIENRKEELITDVLSRNQIKIESRKHAIKTLSDIRIKNYQDDLISRHGDEERIKKAIIREQNKVNEKIKLLDDRLKIVGTYSIDSICLLDVV